MATLQPEKLPSEAVLQEINNIQVFDEAGSPHIFQSLISNPKTLVIFVRHFFCGACQDYLLAISKSITPEAISQLNPPLSIIVIGCSGHELIKFWKEKSSCPYPVYSESTGRIYDKLDMIKNSGEIKKETDYQRGSWTSRAIRSISAALGQGSLMRKAGNPSQDGGELIFEDGKPVWCHRMMGTNDHTNVKDLKLVIGLK